MSRYLYSTALIVALLGCASGVFAQAARPERPYRGLFASGAPNTTQSVVANASISTGYDDNLLAHATGGSGSSGSAAGADVSGPLAQASAALTYSYQTTALSIGASAASSVRFYPSAESEKTVRRSQGQVGVSAQPRDGTSVSAHLSASQQADTYSQLFAVGSDTPFTEPPLLELDTTTALSYYIAYDGGLSVNQSLSRRTKVGGSYGFRRTDGRGYRGEFAHQRAGGLITHQVARGLSLRAGYSYGQAHYGDGHDVPDHLINAGVDFNRALSFSRRTTLAFGAGTAATRSEDALRSTFVWNATLNHEIGRSWLAYAATGRRILLHESWLAPVLANSVTAGINGLINRRLSFTGSVHAALGKVGENTGANKFNSALGNAALSHAISRHWSAALIYAYYHYSAADGVLLSDGQPRNFDRHSIRATVNVWAPLFQRGRRTNVTG